MLDFQQYYEDLFILTDEAIIPLDAMNVPQPAVDLLWSMVTPLLMAF